VNPVLREGNSDRRAPKSVKNYARQNPHSMGAWTPESDQRGAHDPRTTSAPRRESPWSSVRGHHRIQLVREDGQTKVLKKAFPVLAGEVIDGTVMRAARPWIEFLASSRSPDAKEEGVLFSAHLKATMMKVSDPIIFGHVVKAYFSEAFDTYGKQLARRHQPQQRPRLRSCTTASKSCRRTSAKASRTDIKKGLEEGPGTGHGRLGQGHHQPARRPATSSWTRPCPP
jgi:isocitrate dehydrogenase